MHRFIKDGYTQHGAGLEKRFDEEIEKAKFNFFEMSGFKSNPKLALKDGMAIGYKMACDDIAAKLPVEADAKHCQQVSDKCRYKEYGKNCDGCLHYGTA